MPEGAPPPGASSQPTRNPAAVATGAGALGLPGLSLWSPSAAVAEAAAGLGRWSGVGPVDAFDHKSWWPPSIVTFQPLTYSGFFEIERLVIANGTQRRLLVSTLKPPVLEQDGYEWLVTAGNALDVKIAPSTLVFVLPIDTPTGVDDGTIELYALAGSYAAQGPPFSLAPMASSGVVTPSNPVQAAYANCAGTGNVMAWNAGDPFSTAVVRELLAVQIMVTPSTAGGGYASVTFPTLQGALRFNFPVPLTGAESFETSVDAKGVQVGGNAGTYSAFTGAGGMTADLTVIYQ